MNDPIRLRRHFLLFLFLCSGCLSAHAEWVQVTGSAMVENGLFDQARARARDDALQKAVMKFGAQVHSQQEVKRGELTRDYLKVDANAKVRRSEVQEEYLSNGFLHVVMNVQMEEVASCPDSQASQYRKGLAVMGFSLQSPHQAALGNLYGVDQGLSRALQEALRKQDGLILFAGGDTRLYQDSVNAPTRYTVEQQMTNAAELARHLGAQFVVSGVVRDLSVEDQDAFGGSPLQKMLRFGNLSNVTRNFSVDLFVHDGFSGSIIWHKNFVAKADWSASPSEKIGFGSSEFWRMSYGQEVKKLINTMAYLVDEQLRCQPFMTRISRISGKTLHFTSGASTGIRPGDKFALYRTYNFFDAQRMSGIELQNVKTVLTVSQVHPEFGSGTIGIEPGRINIQEDDLLIAW
ncbi:MAG: hypothetical protein C9356_10700 [Oleiphilus sp.]|nr:MAG: hypothetical protein C9356_10700 [Oleiphilus sp.]